MGEERLTWKEIMEKYPREWVGLKDVEWDPDNNSNIKSAVVYRVGKPTTGDMVRAARTPGMCDRHTPGGLLSVGALMI